MFEAALAAHKAGDFAEADARYREVLRGGENADAYGNLGLIQWRRGAVAEAEILLRRAVQLRGDMPGLRYNLGRFLWLTGRLAEAEPELRAVLDLDPAFPDAAVNLGNVLLALGKADEGWKFYQARPERRDSPALKLPFPEWRGEPLQGKRLFVGTEQGFGDHILAARYVAGLEAATVTLCTHRPLARLFAQLPATILPRDPGVPILVEDHDYWTLPLSLPRWARPVPAPYLTASPRSGLGQVGVVWRGNALPDPGRSLPDELGLRLMELPGAVCLHPEQSGAADFLDTAEIIAGLDRVVTIDTSVAHLAGAMGKPVLLLLQHYLSDWRWTLPWYPSVEILRQTSPGDWTGVVAAVRDRLGGIG